MYKLGTQKKRKIIRTNSKRNSSDSNGDENEKAENTLVKIIPGTKIFNVPYIICKMS